MKNMKKKVFALALVVCLIATVSVSTLAWFAANDTVTNEFGIADSTDDANAVFSIDVYEMYDVDGDGDEDKDTDGIVYGANNEVVPGAYLAKKAFVENTGKYDQYARVKVTLSDVSVWASMLGITDVQNASFDLTEIFDVPAAFDTTWIRNDAETVFPTTGNDTLTYVFYYNGVLEADDAAVAFLEGVSIPEEMTRENVVAMGGGFTLAIVAEAVQATNVLDVYGTNEAANALASFAAVNS